MFGFLKNKLKDTISKLSDKIDEEGETEEKEEIKEQVEEEKTEVKEEAKPEEKTPEEPEVKKEIVVEEPPVAIDEPQEEKKGFFSKLKDKFTKQEDEILEDEEPKEEVKEEKKVDISREIPEIKAVLEREARKNKAPKPEPISKKKEMTDDVQDITRNMIYGQKKEDKPVEEPKIKEEPKEVPIPEPKELSDEEKEKIKEQVKEKVDNGRTPSLQELAERKRANISKPKENMKITEVEEPKEEEEVKEQVEPELQPEIAKEETDKKKKSFFGKLKEKITTKKINDHQFEELFWDLELALLENNVAVSVIDKIKDDLKKNIVENPIKRTQIRETITSSLRESIESLFNVEQINLIEKAKSKKPYVICFVGVNGSGKTTTIAKIARLLKNHKLSCVLAAADTFRAAAIDQLEEHANKLDVKLIKHEYGSDPAAVAYDAIAMAKSKGIDVVLIDTAGRLHSNANLVDEMKKIVRVANPDMKIFVGESITGNDCTEQAQKFNEAVDIDAIVLAKADVDEKGGSAISVSYVTGKPILYLGTGQNYEDLNKFDSNIVMQSMGL